MAQLQISIEIADTPTTGYALDKLRAKFGDANAVILDRVIQANAASFPRFEVDSELLIGQVLAAAVALAEE